MASAIGTAIAAAVVCGLAGASAAAPVGVYGPDDRVAIDSATQPWSAIGRVNRTTGGFCTGTLIGPRAVLTAAHCLWNHRTRAWLPATALHFVAGYNRGAYVGEAGVTSYQLAAGLVVDAGGRPKAHADDWAVLTLDADLEAVAGIIPISPALDMAGDQVEHSAVPLAQAGYNRDRAHILSRHNNCPLVGLLPEKSVLLHRCDATEGTSGSPILVRRGSSYVIVAIHVGVASMNEIQVGIATIPAAAELARALGR